MHNARVNAEALPREKVKQFRPRILIYRINLMKWACINLQHFQRPAREIYLNIKRTEKLMQLFNLGSSFL